MLGSALNKDFFPPSIMDRLLKTIYSKCPVKSSQGPRFGKWWLTHGENKALETGRYHDPPQNWTIMTATMAITIAATTIMSINTKACILESLVLSRNLVFGNRTFHFDWHQLDYSDIWVLWGIVAAPVVRNYSRSDYWMSYFLSDYWYLWTVGLPTVTWLCLGLECSNARSFQERSDNR